MHDASQERLSFAAALLDSLPQAALLLDRELRIVHANRRLAALLRLPEGLGPPPVRRASGSSAISPGCRTGRRSAAASWRRARRTGPSPAPPTARRNSETAGVGPVATES
ncbi:hypothetical protein [Streptomyces narbonensis]|uniref:hypothetical protein n=1 Tax=Streptomyces narbonensis TaxID=67333 RepID=UPI003406C6A6